MNEVDPGYVAGEDFQWEHSALYCRTGLYGYAEYHFNYAGAGNLSAFLTLPAEYNVVEDGHLTAGGVAGLGRGPETTLGAVTRYRSAFGAYPRLLYTMVTYYF
jgi:hypothetical protein